MTAIEYLKSLIAGQEIGSSIPVHLLELRMLLAMLEAAK